MDISCSNPRKSGKRRKLLTTGYKINTRINLDEETKEINSLLLKQKELLEEPRTELCKLLIKAEWDHIANEAKVIKNAGSSLQTFGHSRSRFIYLNPEETLYLLEMNKLQFFYDNIRMSVQRSFDLLLNPSTGITVEHYRVFKHFLIYGYKLFRHSVTTNTESIKSIDPEFVEQEDQSNIYENFCRELKFFSPIIEDDFNTNLTQIMYDVYQPQSSFQKAHRPKPDYFLCILKPREKIVSLFRLLSVEKCYNLLFASVSDNSISIFNMHEVQIPDLF